MWVSFVQVIHDCFLTAKLIEDSRHHVESLLLNLLVDSFLCLLKLARVLRRLLCQFIRALH